MITLGQQSKLKVTVLYSHYLRFYFRDANVRASQYNTSIKVIKEINNAKDIKERKIKEIEKH